MDFGSLPPEINSGRIYTGPGSAPMLAAAAAWDGLAAQLHSTAASYASTTSALTAEWRGPSSTAMAAAAAPFAAWLATTAGQAEQTATQARAAAAAYEAAFAATVAPPVIAANRALLMALIATNFLGQNTPSIAATATQYAEMWAQESGAMYAYAAASATAAQVAPFGEPPQTTNAAGATTQSAAAAQTIATSAGTNAQNVPTLMSAMPQALQSLTTPASAAADSSAATAADPPSLLTELNMLITGPLGPTSLYGIGGSPYLLGIENYLIPQNGANLTSAAERLSKIENKTGLLPPDSGVDFRQPMVSATGGARVSAGVGRAGMVGSLSVPQGWTAAAPAIKPLAAVLPQTRLGASAALAADGQSSLFNNMALSSLAGRAIVGTGTSPVRSVSGGGVAQAATQAIIIVIPEDN